MGEGIWLYFCILRFQCAMTKADLLLEMKAHCDRLMELASGFIQDELESSRMCADLVPIAMNKLRLSAMNFHDESSLGTHDFGHAWYPTLASPVCAAVPSQSNNTRWRLASIGFGI